MLDVVKHDSIVIFLNALQGKMLTFIAKHLQVCNNTGQGVKKKGRSSYEPSASSDTWVEREALRGKVSCPITQFKVPCQCSKPSRPFNPESSALTITPVCLCWLRGASTDTWVERETLWEEIKVSCQEHKTIFPCQGSNPRPYNPESSALTITPVCLCWLRDTIAIPLTNSVVLWMWHYHGMTLELAVILFFMVVRNLKFPYTDISPVFFVQWWKAQFWELFVTTPEYHVF